MAGSTFAYRHAKSALFPAVAGFAFPAAAYGSLDLRSSSTAAMPLAPISVLSLHFV